MSEIEKEMEVVGALEFLERNYSLIHNVRNPSRNLSYKAMLNQLEDRPQDFYFKNSGVVVANGRYILNGGHTRLALEEAKRRGYDLSEVQLEVTHFPHLSKQKMSEITVARNTNSSPQLYGVKDIQGTWNQIKRQLDAKYEPLYEFRPNTKKDAPYTVSFLVALLHAIHCKGAEKSYSNKNALLRLYTNEKYKEILPKLNELIELYSFIYTELSKDSKIQELEGVRNVSGIIFRKANRVVLLPDGSENEWFIPEGYLFPFYSSMTALYNPKRGTFRYAPRTIFKEAMPELIKIFLRSYRYYRNPNKLGKDKDTYLKLILAVQQIVIDR